MSQKPSIPDDWWPEWMQDIASEDPLASDPVVAAAIEATEAEHQHYRQLFTALAPVDALDGLLTHPGGIGFEASSNGPHPSYSDDEWEYEPRFWVAGTAAVPDLEPLVVRWRSGSRIVLRPDQGFLMTYGLVPRLATSAEVGYVEHWDDVEEPRPDVVVVRPVSTYDVLRHSGALVTVAKDWLQDYATLRKKAFVQVYYVQRRGIPTGELDEILKGSGSRDFELRGRRIDVQRVHDGQILVQVRGVRHLLSPGPAPISAGRWDYGSLGWPGFPEPITHDDAMKLGPLDVVYVRDSVLGLYEGRNDYDVHPESGAVSYGNQWGVTWTRRVNRDLIAVELKKLYEGNYPDTVRHWHAHAVARPVKVAYDHPNVGTRARRIVYAMTGLGEALAAIASQTSSDSLSGADFVGLNRADLDYDGWWTAEHVEPIARHIPLELTEDDFLGRCSDLYQLVGEGLSEASLRRLLTTLGIPPDDIKEFRSLRLLAHLIQVADLAVRTGLPIGNGKELHDRLKEGAAPITIERLFALNDLRQLADHRAGSHAGTRLVDALRAFGLDPASFAGGWGLALDAVYDGVAETLEQAAETLMKAAT